LATHLSAIKRAKQAEKRRFRNLHIKTTVKSSIKKVREAIEGKDVEGAQKALLKAIPLIQKAHSKGVFHKNTSARKISHLTREVNALSAERREQRA
jgi:small subunit ribosomal protein S20